MILKAVRADVAEGGVQSSGVIDLLDKAGNVGSDIVESLLGHQVNGLDLQCLHEALGLGIVVGIAAAPHRTDQAMVS